jgi:hypothetical protein
MPLPDHKYLLHKTLTRNHKSGHRCTLYKPGRNTLPRHSYRRGSLPLEERNFPVSEWMPLWRFAQELHRSAMTWRLQATIE